MKVTRKPKGSKRLDDFNIISVQDNSWRYKAACNTPEVDTSWFFDNPKTYEARKALKICSSCPVKANCLYDAIMYQYHGIWGGFTQETRAKIISVYLENDLTEFSVEKANEIYEHVGTEVIVTKRRTRQPNKKQ